MKMRVLMAAMMVWISAWAVAQTGKHYELDGVITAIDRAHQTLTVRHQAIAGFMPAMTMVYGLRDPKQMNQLKTGDSIHAGIQTPAKDDVYLLDDVRVTGHGESASAEVTPLKINDRVPDVWMMNQDGVSTHLAGYRGKVLLVTFIYTRCPLPTACPMISSHFAALHAQLSQDAQVLTRTHMLSITLDPEYDTPAVLRRYGMAYLDNNHAGFSHWEFARTAPGDLEKLAHAFGLEYRSEGRQITHTVRTLLISADGRLIESWNGSGWDPDAVAATIRRTVGAER